MTREKGVSECYQSIGLTCPTFWPNFYFFLGPPGPLTSKKTFLASIKLHGELFSLSQCCGSGMFIPDPDFYPSQISQNWNYFIFEKLKKKVGPFFKEYRNRTLPKKLSLSSLKNGFGIWDPGSRKTYFRSRIQGSKRHRIPDLRSQN